MKKKQNKLIKEINTVINYQEGYTYSASTIAPFFTLAEQVILGNQLTILKCLKCILEKQNEKETK